MGQQAECVPDPNKLDEFTERDFPPRVSVQVYLIYLSVIMFIAFMAFLLLWRTEQSSKTKHLIPK